MPQVVGRANNNGCVGKKIYVDPREPEEKDPTSAIRYLKYMPSMVMVQPNNAPKPWPLKATATAPDGWLGIVPKKLSSTHDFGKGAGRVKLTVNGVEQPSVTITRTQLPLAEGYVVTDYYTQGMSFKKTGHTWVIHITPTDGGKFQRASLFVLLSRFSSWDDVKILVPLFTDSTTHEAKEALIDRFLKCTDLEPDLSAEVERLASIAVKTKAKHFQFISALFGGG
jgi:hypothetical protein